MSNRKRSDQCHYFIEEKSAAFVNETLDHRNGTDAAQAYTV